MPPTVYGYYTLVCYDKKVKERRLIVAYGQNGEIGGGNDLLWHLPADMKHFRDLTMGTSIIMGGNTWRSIGRSLPGRETIVLTRAAMEIPDIIAVRSLDEAFRRASRDRVYVIGGGEIYSQALAGNYVDAIDATEVDAVFPEATVFFERPNDGWRETARQTHPHDDKNLYDYDFVTYERDTK